MTTFAQTRSPRSLSLAAVDVCKMLLYPIPLPNIAQYSMARVKCTDVMIESLPVYTQSDRIPLSIGNEISTPFGGGIISGKTMGEARTIKGSTTVFIKGKPVVRMLDPALHNGMNAVGITISPAQTKVLVNS